MNIPIITSSHLNALESAYRNLEMMQGQELLLNMEFSQIKLPAKSMMVGRKKKMKSCFGIKEKKCKSLLKAIHKINCKRSGKKSAIGLLVANQKPSTGLTQSTIHVKLISCIAKNF